MNTLIIIGNGFDLAHGIKTTYTDFIDYLIRENKTQVKHPKLFKRPHNCTIEEFKEYYNGVNGHLVDLTSNNLLAIFINAQSESTWSDIEELYFYILKNVKEYHQFDKNPENLNLQFKAIKEALSDYLHTEQTNARKIQSYSELFRKMNHNQTTIINFNYTGLIKNLYGEESDKINKIHIHGEIESTINPIVFGYAATASDSRILIEKNKNEYMRHVKSHMYKQANNESRLYERLNRSTRIHVLILGHSCGLSDNKILNTIFNHKNVSTIRTLYFEMYENYFNSTVNIDRIMNNEENFNNRIVNFNDTHRMPQTNDTSEQEIKFNDYINKFLRTYNTQGSFLNIPNS